MFNINDTVTFINYYIVCNHFSGQLIQNNSHFRFQNLSTRTRRYFSIVSAITYGDDTTVFYLFNKNSTPGVQFYGNNDKYNNSRERAGHRR